MNWRKILAWFLVCLFGFFTLELVVISSQPHPSRGQNEAIGRAIAYVIVLLGLLLSVRWVRRLRHPKPKN